MKDALFSPTRPVIFATLLLQLLSLRGVKADESTAPAARPAGPAPSSSVTGALVISPTAFLDNMVMGDHSSEEQHQLQAEESDVIKGAFDLSARRLLPGGAQPWDGGKLSFAMKVDPHSQNYVTVRLWGSSLDPNMLFLFCEGKQVGYRHNGDVDLVANADEEPRYPGRFYYTTTPLPRAMTDGKSEIHLELRATGPIYAYATTFDQYQKTMTEPSREIYRVYTHTDGCFVPPSEEKQGDPSQLPTRTTPGPEVLDQLKTRVNDTIGKIMGSEKPPDQMQLQFLAKAYWTKWCSGYNSQRLVDQVVKGVDNLYERFKANPEDVFHDKATWNPGWFAVGPGADAVRLLAKPLAPRLDEKLDGDTTRREAWSQMFQASRDHLRMNRPWLTNQSMFADVNIYRSNRAVAAIDSGHALPEDKALRYLYEAAGLQPWLGSDAANGKSEMQFGANFFQVTPKGITRELGYSGDYGEGGAEGAMEIYDATRDPGGEGDPKIKAQLVKMFRARGIFRYPAPDADGNRAMRLETVVGWRDFHYPGRVTYVQRSTDIIEPVAVTLDPQLIGWAQQMFDDNQFFSILAEQLKRNRFRDTTGIIGLPESYDLVKAQPPSSYRLPMTPGQPDFAWADETDGVVAIKNGAEILYASLYWRAGFGINSLARVHDLTPHYQQIATVHEDVQYDDSGKTYTRPDWINFGFGNGGFKYPEGIHQAFAGEVLPIPQVPADVKTPTHFVGRGSFYTLRFGPYLIGMNMTTDKTFQLQVPADAKSAKELISKRSDIAPGATESVGPQSTMVLYLGK